MGSDFRFAVVFESDPLFASSPNFRIVPPTGSEPDFPGVPLVGDPGGSGTVCVIDDGKGIAPFAADP